MKLFNLLFVLSLAPNVVFANDIFFNRLTRLYSKNPEKCLEAAKRFINYFPNESSSYMYASKVYYDKSTIARNSRLEYSLLKKAISYAVKFELIKNEDSIEKINWERDKAAMKMSVNKLSEKLSNEDQQSLSASLKIAFSKLDDMEEIVELTENLPEKVEADSDFPTSTKGFMFGLPNGNENVRSSNVSEEQALLGMINQERKKLGMEPLVWEENLARAARYHAFDLGSQKYFDHNSYDRVNGELEKVGGTFARIGRFYNSSSLNSENIAAGSKHAVGTYEQWFNSKGHYDNMFNKQSKKVGIGYYFDPDAPFQFYWVFCTAL